MREYNCNEADTIKHGITQDFFLFIENVIRKIWRFMNTIYVSRGSMAKIGSLVDPGFRLPSHARDKWEFVLVKVWRTKPPPVVAFMTFSDIAPRIAR